MGLQFGLSKPLHKSLFNDKCTNWEKEQDHVSTINYFMLILNYSGNNFVSQTDQICKYRWVR